MQKPSEFVREQVIAVRDKVDHVAGQVAAEASIVSATVTSQVGDFIREQRGAAQVSLRELARTAGVSNPYLSQVERGLRKPSAEILAAIARGLKISAETLYEQAGMLDRRSGSADTIAVIRADHALSERHKAVLLELYETFVREHAGSPAAPTAGRAAATKAAATKAASTEAGQTRAASTKTASTSAASTSAASAKAAPPKAAHPKAAHPKAAQTVPPATPSAPSSKESA